MSRAPVSPADIQSVLVVKPSSMGDIVHTLPSVHLLKRTWPHLKISWIINTEWSPLLAGNPDIDKVILFPRRGIRNLFDLYKLRNCFWETRRAKPELALDFQGLMRSALISRFSGARAIHCLGDAELPVRILSHRVVPAERKAEHSVTRYLKLVADLGADTSAPLRFPITDGVKPLGAGLPDRYLLVHPFSRGQNKSIGHDSLSRMAELLPSIPIVLAGRADKSYHPPKNMVNLLNRTSLAEMIWLVRNAHFTMSVDSGPMHIAAAVSGRLLGIHNWTNPKLVGPYNPEAWIWKGGALMKMRDFPVEPSLDSRPFGLEHVEKVAAFLKEQFDAADFAEAPQAK